MGVTIVWDNSEENTLRYDLEGTWEWEEIREGVNTVFDLMDSANTERIGAIIHFKDSVKIPKGGMKHFSVLTERSHPKAGLTVIVGAGRWLKTTIKTASNLYRMSGRSLDFHYADTLDEARQLIAQDLRVNRSND